MPLRLTVAGLLLALGFLACSPEQEQSNRPATSDTKNYTAIIVSDGFHSGLILERSLLGADRVPEAADFPNTPYLEFGWGDAAYYTAEKPSLFVTLSAGMLPTPSVLHVIGLASVPSPYEPQAEHVALQLSGGQLSRLIAFIHATFDRGNRPRAASSQPGYFPTSLFYPALGQFHIFNTCNTWIANALEAAGFQVDSGTMRAASLMEQVRELSTL